MSHLFGSAQRGVNDRQVAGQHRRTLLGLTAWQQHCLLVKDFQKHYGASLPEPEQTQRTDLDSLVEHHRFIRKPEDDAKGSWEVRLAQKYYSKLFKEYALVDLSHYKSGLYGLRWRTKTEVVEGRGQFSCGCKGCDQRQQLASYELPFSYKEGGQQRQALVKVRLCPEHVLQLTYRKTKAALKQQAGEKRKLEHKSKVSSGNGATGLAPEHQHDDVQQHQQHGQLGDSHNMHDSAHRKKKRQRPGGSPAAIAQSAANTVTHPKEADDAPEDRSAQPVQTADDLLADTVAQWQEAFAG